jgi:hypothetical protein
MAVRRGAPLKRTPNKRNSAVFGGNAHRFEQPSVRAPGPGQYDHQHLHRRSGSVTERTSSSRGGADGGTGGGGGGGGGRPKTWASFKSQSHRALPFRPAESPGPAQYDTSVQDLGPSHSRPTTPRGGGGGGAGGEYSYGTAQSPRARGGGGSASYRSASPREYQQDRNVYGLRAARAPSPDRYN